jgi:hypothetical protein
VKTSLHLLVSLCLLVGAAQGKAPRTEHFTTGTPASTRAWMTDPAFQRADELLFDGSRMTLPGLIYSFSEIVE